MVVKIIREPVKRGTRRIPLPMLLPIMQRQGKTKSWLAESLGYRKRQAFHNAEAAGGWPETEVPRIAELLGVPIATLTATGARPTNPTPAVRALMLQPELARLADDAADAVRQQMADAVEQAVAATVALLASGTVPMPVRGTVALTPADVTELEAKTAVRPHSAAAPRGQSSRVQQRRR